MLLQCMIALGDLLCCVTYHNAIKQWMNVISRKLIWNEIATVLNFYENCENSIRYYISYSKHSALNALKRTLKGARYKSPILSLKSLPTKDVYIHSININSTLHSRKLIQI